MVITGLTRNQFASNRTRVRIPPSPPSKNPVTMRVSGFFLFYTHSKNHPIFSCSFHSFGKNSFSLYSLHFSATVSHLLWRLKLTADTGRRRFCFSFVSLFGKSCGYIPYVPFISVIVVAEHHIVVFFLDL